MHGNQPVLSGLEPVYQFQKGKQFVFRLINNRIKLMISIYNVCHNSTMLNNVDLDPDEIINIFNKVQQKKVIYLPLGNDDVMSCIVRMKVCSINRSKSL